jgi:hypothetical protein
MKCSALGFKKNNSDDNSSINWHPPFANVLFNNNSSLQAKKAQLIDACNKLNTDDYISLAVNNYYLSLIKTQDYCCMVASDQELTRKNLVCLARWMAHKDISLEFIADNFELCIQNHEPALYLIKQTNNETIEVLKKNVDLLVERGECLDELSKKVENLHDVSFQFRERVKDDSCLPKCNIF